VDLPISNRSEPLKIGLWRLTDAKYREAEEAYMRKCAQAVTEFLHLAAEPSKSAALTVTVR